MHKGFQFGRSMGLRKAETVGDLVELRRMVAADEHHRGVLAPEFFAGDHPAAECFAIEDEQGTVLYFRIERALRVYVQFDPAADQVRTANALSEGFNWLEERARRSGFRQLIFDSVSKPLRAFCRRRFGFKESANELVRVITPPDVNTAQENPALMVHHDIYAKGGSDDVRRS